MFNIANDFNMIESMSGDDDLKITLQNYYLAVNKYRYTYNFSWLGRPIIQHPQDIIALQEIIWQLKPDLIIETGIAHGGSLIFYSSILELLGGDGRVVGIDIDIRQHNKSEIEKHPMMQRIIMVEGSSLEDKTFKKVSDIASGKKTIMVVLDSNHTHDHVLNELKLYSPLVTKDSYLVVFDTRIEDLPPDRFKDSPWGKGNNPKTAVWEFLKNSDRFIIDKDIEKRILLTGAPDGYLKCIK